MGDLETEIPRDRQEDRDRGHGETKTARRGLRNRERGTQRLERDMGAGERAGIGGALTCPQICSWSLTPGRCGCLCCCLHCLTRALEEVTARGGGRGRGRGVGGGSSGETQSRGPVACEYQSRSESRATAAREPGSQSVTLSHPSHPAVTHNRSHAATHGVTRGPIH